MYFVSDALHLFDGIGRQRTTGTYQAFSFCLQLPEGAFRFLQYPQIAFAHRRRIEESLVNLEDGSDISLRGACQVAH